MKGFMILLLFFSSLFFYHRISHHGDADGVKRTRLITLWISAMFAGIMLLSFGMRIGWVGGMMALAGAVLLTGALITGLMKLRDWLS
ncbi:MAG: hypothetical protein M0Z65_08000 [Firmicutes bacterium]|uniref:Uncharacterized protein n=1 Tax=Melghirimyces thermohalophilus TaxID=1236220 RepID=A0A1G6LQS4_9BACL|nr:hypothetical protein [Melghirimyces thermohalophilus]MDA8353112.1 hypothetical protein [Bacillota bacterium]SDC45447.1 hypothetical protein SAMN04488112_10879 [Melghirimyces thermohalophilus]